MVAVTTVSVDILHFNRKACNPWIIWILRKSNPMPEHSKKWRSAVKWAVHFTGEVINLIGCYETTKKNWLYIYIQCVDCFSVHNNLWLCSRTQPKCTSDEQFGTWPLHRLRQARSYYKRSQSLWYKAYKWQLTAGCQGRGRLWHCCLQVRVTTRARH